MTTNTQQTISEQIIRMPELEQRTGYSRNSIYSKIRAGTFPKNLKLSANGRASGWLLSEVNAWLAERIEARNAGGGAK